MSACEALVNSDTRTTTTIIISTIHHIPSRWWWRWLIQLELIVILHIIHLIAQLYLFPAAAAAAPHRQLIKVRVANHLSMLWKGANERQKFANHVSCIRIRCQIEEGRISMLYFINDFLLNIELRQYVVFEYEGGCSNSRRSMRVSFRLLWLLNANIIIIISSSSLNIQLPCSGALVTQHNILNWMYVSTNSCPSSLLLRLLLLLQLRLLLRPPPAPPLSPLLIPI